MALKFQCSFALDDERNSNKTPNKYWWEKQGHCKVLRHPSSLTAAEYLSSPAKRYISSVILKIELSRLSYS